MGKLRGFLMVVLFAGTLSAHAQQVKFGLKGGFDLTELKLKNAGEIFKADNNVGWFVGPTMKLSLPGGLGFDLSALYNQRETDLGIFYVPNNSSDARPLDKLKTKQVIVPLNVRYTIGLSDMFSIFGYAGPQVAFRLGDEVQKLADLRDEMAEWRLKDSNFSVNVGAGITIEHFQLSANYNVGVGKTGDVTWRDATQAASEGFKGNYNSWQISLAYFF